MGKLDRLRWLEKTFGRRRVLQYRVSRNWADFHQDAMWALRCLKQRGIRTEGGHGYDCPFVFPFVHMNQAKELWRKSRGRLTYIVCEGVWPVVAHGVAIRIGDREALFEVNDKERLIAQRHMYRNPGNLRRVVLGPGGHCIWNRVVWRVYEPECGDPLRLDEVYRDLFRSRVDELTFTLARGKLIYW